MRVLTSSQGIGDIALEDIWCMSLRLVHTCKEQEGVPHVRRRYHHSYLLVDQTGCSEQSTCSKYSMVLEHSGKEAAVLASMTCSFY